MKILLLRFSSIGDIVLTTPVPRCLKKQIGAEVHFLTKKSFAGILEPNPYIDKVYTFGREVTEVLPQLKYEKYDYIVDLHHNLRSARVKWALGCPSRAFRKLNFEKWLLVNLKINRLPDKHIVHRYLEAAAELGVQYDGGGLDYFIPADQELPVETVDARLREGRFIAFAIGATHATKRLPPEKIAAVCAGIQQPVVLLGGKTEAEYSAGLAAQAGAHVVDLCGKLSLHQSASVVRQAARVLTHDTGLMHIAAAFRKEIVSFWGSTVPEFGMYPFYPEGFSCNTTLEVKHLSCRPCSKIGFERCPKGHFSCMQTLNWEPAATRAVDF